MEKYNGKLDSTKYCGINQTDFNLSRRTMTDIAEQIMHDKAFDRMCYKNIVGRENLKKLDKEKEEKESEAF